MIEKMMWVSPKTQIQQFAANDRVSACLNLRCMLPTAENDKGFYGAGQSGWLNPNGGSHYGFDMSSWEWQWMYNETDTGLLHREHECGAGAGIDPSTGAEFNNPAAKIQDVWLDGFGVLNDGSIGRVNNGDSVFNDNSEKFSLYDLMNRTVVGLQNVLAKWTTLLGTTTYTHIGIADWDENSKNHS